MLKQNEEELVWEPLGKEGSAIQHLNHNLLCAGRTITTGTRPGYHELVQIALLPLDANFNYIYKPFSIGVLPQNPERCGIKNAKLAQYVKETNLDLYESQEIFEDWFKKNVTEKGFKKIAYLGYDVLRDWEFIKCWMNYDDINDPNHSFAQAFFEPIYFRDVRFIATYLNDLAYSLGQKVPFSHLKLASICTAFMVPYQHYPGGALEGAMVIREIYRRMMKVMGIKMVDFGAVV